MSTKSFPVWLDRDSVKEQMVRWLHYGNSCFLISHSDPHECDDISAWIKSQNTSRKVVDVYINIETLSKFSVLQQISNRFNHEFQRFNEFETVHAQLGIEQMKNVVINQSAGTNLHAQQNVEVSGVNQNANVTLNHEEIKKTYFDSVVSSGFNKFLEDFVPALQKRPIAILFHIQGNGFNSLGRNFCNWFRYDFLQKLKELNHANLKLCILCENDWGELNNEASYNSRTPIRSLSYNDVVSATNGLIENNIDYSDGLVNLERQIDYRTLKLKLEQKLFGNQL